VFAWDLVGMKFGKYLLHVSTAKEIAIYIRNTVK